LGIIGRGQIRRSGGSEKGSGLALAGIVLGALFLAVVIAAILFLVTRNTNDSGLLSGPLRR
jgi:small-conductance mechanosensitive channel